MIPKLKIPTLIEVVTVAKNLLDMVDTKNELLKDAVGRFISVCEKVIDHYTHLLDNFNSIFNTLSPYGLKITERLNAIIANPAIANDTVLWSHIQGFAGAVKSLGGAATVRSSIEASAGKFYHKEFFAYSANLQSIFSLFGKGREMSLYDLKPLMETLAASPI